MCSAVADRSAGSSTRSNGPCSIRTRRAIYSSTTSPSSGPVNVLKLKFTPRDFDRRVVVELWAYPDGSRILELSTKCPPADAFTAAAETKAYLTAHGIDLAAPQETKTRSALEFFAKELRDAEGS